MSYDYRVSRVRRVVDGDTLDLDLDVGFYLTTAQRIRLLGVDTPERGRPGWADATTYVSRWLEAVEASGAELRCSTRKADSFGRWLGAVHADGVDLSASLLEAGHAVPYRA